LLNIQGNINKLKGKRNDLDNWDLFIQLVNAAFTSKKKVLNDSPLTKNNFPNIDSISIL